MTHHKFAWQSNTPKLPQVGEGRPMLVNDKAKPGGFQLANKGHENVAPELLNSTSANPILQLAASAPTRPASQRYPALRRLDAITEKVISALRKLTDQESMDQQCLPNSVILS